MSRRLYVGHIPLNPTGQVFWWDGTPTEQTHGHIYSYVTGPFRTRAGADFMAAYGNGNPHCQSVYQAEQLARVERVNRAIESILGEA